MLTKIDCPSYIQTYSTDEGENKIEVAMVPWDQFHTMMTMIAHNNMSLIEVNTLLYDMNEWLKQGSLSKNDPLYKRLAQYLKAL